jgi:hypothetical protein
MASSADLPIPSELCFDLKVSNLSHIYEIAKVMTVRIPLERKKIQTLGDAINDKLSSKAIKGIEKNAYIRCSVHWQ